MANKVKRDSDPKNDWSDGRSSGIRYVAKKLGLRWSELMEQLKKGGESK